MSKPYDATLKALLEASPGDWPRLAGFVPDSVKIIDADVSTVTAATDKVLLLEGSEPTLMHFEFQAGPDPSLPRRMLGYNALLAERHGMPVHSVMVLLRSQANLVQYNGLYQQYYPGLPEPYLIFRYQVIRVWQLPVINVLHGGIGTLALAPLGLLAEIELPSVIQEIKQRLEQAEHEQTAGEVWTAIRILMGLRYETALIEQPLRGVHRMKESVTYQEILNEGRIEEALRILLLLGERAFHQPASQEVQTALKAIGTYQPLEHLVVTLHQFNNWEELIDSVPRSPRIGKKK